MASVEAMVMVDDGTVVPKSMVMRWIPVTERLPEDGKIVLVTIKGAKDPFIAKYVAGDGWFDGELYEYDGILAWMDLPEMYEGDADSAMLDELSGEEERIAMEENPW